MARYLESNQCSTHSPAWTSYVRNVMPRYGVPSTPCNAPSSTLTRPLRWVRASNRLSNSSQSVHPVSRDRSLRWRTRQLPVRKPKSDVTFSRWCCGSAMGSSAVRWKRISQFFSHVRSPSREYACCQRASVAVMSLHS